MKSIKSLLCSHKVRKTHKILQKENLLPPQSIVISCTGHEYVEEAILSAQFAANNAINAKEIIIVTDQYIPFNEISNISEKIRIDYFDPSSYTPRDHSYSNIYRSRICKIYAPNYAAHERVLMIDSDLMLLQEPLLPWHKWGIAGSFRKGKMISKFKRSGEKRMPAPLKGTCRPYLQDHLNTALIAAPKTVFSNLSQLWIQYYQEIWGTLPENQPPTDQLPFTCVLDHLGLTTINAGDDINWPVSKKIGGKHAQIPASVIGAHGGLPLSEWRKYQQDRNSNLSFVDSKTTRRVRYQPDNQTNNI